MSGRANLLSKAKGVKEIIVVMVVTGGLGTFQSLFPSLRSSCLHKLIPSEKAGPWDRFLLKKTAQWLDMLLLSGVFFHTAISMPIGNTFVKFGSSQFLQVLQKDVNQTRPPGHPLQGTNMSHLGKRKVIFKTCRLGWDMLGPRRVNFQKMCFHKLLETQSSQRAYFPPAKAAKALWSDSYTCDSPGGSV